MLIGMRFSRKPKWARFFPGAELISENDLARVCARPNCLPVGSLTLPVGAYDKSLLAPTLRGEKAMEDEIAEVVREHGWFAASISDHAPPFLYSIGLMQTWNHPELVVFGLDPNDAHALLSWMIREIRAGRSFAQKGVCTVALAEDRRIGLRRVHPTQHSLYLGFAMGYSRYTGRIGELEAVQVFWPDSRGRFPFEVGCDIGVYQCQPRLDIALTPSDIREFERQWE